MNYAEQCRDVANLMRQDAMFENEFVRDAEIRRAALLDAAAGLWEAATMVQLCIIEDTPNSSKYMWPFDGAAVMRHLTPPINSANAAARGAE